MHAAAHRMIRPTQRCQSLYRRCRHRRSRRRGTSRQGLSQRGMSCNRRSLPPTEFWVREKRKHIIHGRCRHQHKLGTFLPPTSSTHCGQVSSCCLHHLTTSCQYQNAHFQLADCNPVCSKSIPNRWVITSLACHWMSFHTYIRSGHYSKHFKTTFTKRRNNPCPSP